MVYLAYTGMDNIFLTEDPDFTHFKTVYTRDQQSATKVVEHPFDQPNYNVGDTLIATLKQNGDFLSKVSLKVKLPKITPTTSYWVYPDVNKFIGSTVSLFTSAGSKIFDMTVNGLTATTVNQNWLVVTSNTYVPPSTYVSVTTANKFLFNVPSGSYAVFSDISFANFFGFVYNPIQLFGGYVRFNRVNTEQVTFQEAGWLSGEQVYNPTYSYLDDTLYKLINSVSLYIGKQLVQEFDANTIKFYKETNSTYKNRPVLKLLEGNDTVIDDNRVYYFEIPFIVVPVYAIPRHDVQIRIKTNPLSSDVNFFMSLVLTYNTFSSKLPSEHTIIVPQVSYFTNNKLDMKGPVKKIVVSSGNPTFSLSLNGEFFADDVNTKTYAFENLRNVPMSSNSVVVFNNPINMSRIRDQIFSSNTMNYFTGSEPVSEEITQGVYTFTSDGTLTIPSGVSVTCDILVVAGGGGGGGTNDRTAGGGGAGGVVYLQNQTLNSNTYAIVVGQGGTGGPNGSNGSNGGNSSLGTLAIAIGGGGGAGPNFVNGNSGGSGGGICHGAGTAGSGTTGQGYGGGPLSANDGFNGIFTASGGGGAGGIGGNGTRSGGGSGGPGILVSITGTPTYYAGGGGGSANYIYTTSVSGGQGGVGGGGSGATTSGPNNSYVSVSGGDATYYGGGGGGSAGNSASVPPCKGGDGYQGIVIVKITSVQNQNQTAQIINGIYAESLNVLKISNDLSGLLYTTKDTSGYPVVTSSITNPVSTQETYLFDQIPQTVSGMLSFYSMRLVNYGYKGPIIRLRNQNTNEEDDFYTDTTQSFLKTSNGTTINDFSNGSNIRVVTWYDQTINGNHLTQSIQVVQPQLVLDGSKYVVAILNDSNNFDSVSPTRWMDITKPVHPQQFAMTMKLNSVGFFQNPVCIFSSQKGIFRITGGNLSGDSTAEDWANLPNSGTTYFTVDGSYASSISAGSWYRITSWKDNAYSGYDMNLIGVSAPGVYQTPSRSMNGYFFELGFMSQKTLETESVDYYDNRPPL